LLRIAEKLSQYCGSPAALVPATAARAGRYAAQRMENSIEFVDVCVDSAPVAV
jgi:hypothetical protein